MSVTVDALGGRTFNGVVTAINPVATEAARLFLVRVSLSDGVADLKPGMFARGEVLIGEPYEAIMIPSETIVESEGNTFVFVMEEGTAVRKTVVTKAKRDGLTEVEGLMPGELLVVKGQTVVGDGSPVKVDDGESAGAED